MKKARILLLVFILAHQFTLAQDSLNYVIRFPNARHHEAEIILQLRNVREPSLILRMSQSSPGRYAMHQFAKNIYDISPTGNQKATIKRIAPEAWEVSDIKGSVDIRYTLFANRADGTYSGIDRDFAVLNMPSTLLWPENKLHLPVLVQFDLPDSINWRIATPLSVADSAKKQFTAPNLSYLMDSPCLLGNLKLREFYVAEDSVPRIRMALHTVANDAEIDILVEMAKKALAEQKEVFGEFPAFEDSTYTFLCGYGPGYYDDGMEHRNATMITSNIPLGGNQEWLIGTLSHEFFHVWNMERLRPASLEPFDFTRANISGELWFGEGFTSYYGDLALCRSGVLDTDKYLYTIGSTINYISNAPGWRYGSPVHMSEMATFTDQSSFVDETNFANTFISYYTYGEMIALALDLTLRSSFQDVSLDDYMKALWIKYGKNEKSYTNLDLMHTLGEVCGDKQFAHQFFEKHIFGNTLPDFAGLFEKFGYRLIKKNPGKPSIGFVRFKFEGDTATLLSDPLVGTALYDAGVNKGDLILAIDDQPLTSYPELNFIVGTRQTGDEIEVVYSHLGKKLKGSFRLKEDGQVVLIPKEKFSIKLSDEEKFLRDEWLKPRAK